MEVVNDKGEVIYRKLLGPPNINTYTNLTALTESEELMLQDARILHRHREARAKMDVDIDWRHLSEQNNN